MKKGPWTPEEDEKLIAYIKKHGQGNWRTLPKNAGERPDLDGRSLYIISSIIRIDISMHIYAHPGSIHRSLPWLAHAGLARCGKSCRLRWTNYLRPDIKRGRFSFEEEETIIQLHSILGNK